MRMKSDNKKFSGLLFLEEKEGIQRKNNSASINTESPGTDFFERKSGRAVLEDPSHLTLSLRLNSIHLRTIPSAISNEGKGGGGGRVGIAKGVTTNVENTSRIRIEGDAREERSKAKVRLLSGRESFVGKYHKSTLTALPLSLSFLPRFSHNKLSFIYKPARGKLNT